MAVTKLELQQLLATRNAEVEALRIRVAELEGDITALKAKAGRTFGPRPVTRPAYEPTPEQLARRAAMAAAREMAMKTGHFVRVGE